MKTAIARLALLVLAAMFLPVKGWDDTTYVSNQSSRSIRATTIYHFPGSSGFHNRLITPGTAQSDQYSGIECEDFGDSPYLQVQAWVDGSQKSATVNIYCDISIVAVDNNGKTGVDIYQSVYGGSINKPTGDVLGTIYP